MAEIQKFGKYEVLDKIGVGGFGVVYRAFDPLIKRMVAVKTCTTDDEEVRTRFFQEAEIAGNLQHRNVVTVYDFGIQEEVPYLVQEYLSGEDLDKKIKGKTKLPYPDRVSYLVQIARGMEFAHSKGVVHRDIKPANIRILEDGTAKIMDFGIAKLAQRHTGLTQTGMTLGTAAYLAPEQIRGEPVDSRTDIFSFGAMAYELLTFRKMFEGETISTVLYQILHKDPPSVREAWPEAPETLNAIVAKCLAKDANGRYSTTSELVSDLEHVHQAIRAPARPPSLKLDIDTSSLPTTAIRTGSPASVAAAAAAAATAAGGDATAPRAAAPAIDLAYRPDAAAGAVPISDRGAKGGALKWAAGALVAVGVAVGGWWALQGGQRTTAPPTAPTAATASTPADEPAEEPKALDPAPAVVTEPAAVAPVLPAEPPVATPPPAPAPPKPPAKGTLVVPAADDPRTTLTVDGGPARTLDRDIRLELEPGPHDLAFELIAPGYEDSQRVRVTLREKEAKTVENPVLAPGQITVQPALGTPMGTVRLDGDDFGQAPVRARLVRAGTHRLEVIPLRLDGQSGRPASTEVTIRSGTLTTVTFDLFEGAVRNVHERPAAAPAAGG